MDGPRVQPSLLVAAAILLGWVVGYFGDLPELPQEAQTAGAPTILVGLGLLAWALVVQVKAGNNPEIHQPTGRLITSGPYRYTRNPVYVGFLIAQVGIGLTLAWPIIVLVPFTGWLLHRYVVLPEEAQLASQFQEYDAYRGQVRRWL